VVIFATELYIWVYFGDCLKKHKQIELLKLIAMYL